MQIVVIVVIGHWPIQMEDPKRHHISPSIGRFHACVPSIKHPLMYANLSGNYSRQWQPSDKTGQTDF